MHTAEEEIAQMERLCQAGLAPRRTLPEGWNTAAGSRRRLKAAYIQYRQNASAEQQECILEELFECLELDLQMCKVQLFPDY